MGQYDGVKIPAYLFAGFSVFLTLRLALHGSTFCLIRFQIPEHLFSLYVNRIHNAMQLFTLFGSAFGTAVIYGMKANETEDTKENLEKAKKYLSIVVSWALFSINVIILIAFVVGGKNGCITFFYWSMAISSFIFSTNMQFIFSMAGPNVVWYLASENSTQILTSFLHWILLLFYGNRRKHYTEFVVIVYQIVISSMVTGVSAALWTVVYTDKGEGGGGADNHKEAAKALRAAAKEIQKLVGTGVPLNTDFKTKVGTTGAGSKTGLAGEAEKAASALSQCKAANTALTTLKEKAKALYEAIGQLPGGRTKPAHEVDTQLKALKTALDEAANILDTLDDDTCNKSNPHAPELTALAQAADNTGSGLKQKAIEAYNAYYTNRWPLAFSPMAMCAIGLGMVFAFYPAIAPGMLVEFRLVHRVDMILLFVSPIPSVSIALLSKIDNEYRDYLNPATNPWDKTKTQYWHVCHIFTVTEITCAILFIIALQYPHLSMSKDLRRPFWACVISIVFYMSQEILAALGYGGVEGNAGTQKDILANINNFLVRLSMIIFIFFAEGYTRDLKV